MSEKECARCGALFAKTPGPGRWPKHCDKCRANTPRTCLSCGRGFTGLRSGYCSKECWPERRSYPRNRQPSPTIVVEGACPVCGVAWLRTRTANGPPTKDDHCSAKCRAIGRRRQDGKWTRGESRSCAYCGEQFKPVRPNQSVCCPRHGWLYRSSVRPKNPDWLEGRRSERLLDCSVCGVPVMTGGTNIKCPPCKAEATKATNRRKNAKRRGAKIGENFTLAEIGDRDGWRCHLCRRPVRRELSGLHDRGPTIDHLIPIAAGGVDEPENVALAHRDCNVLRRHLGAAQLRLIA